MVNQIEEADFVLVVCTENYEKRFKGKGEAGKGIGAKYEGAIITQELYYSEANNKCIPIVFSSEDSKYIPSILKSATYYTLYTEKNCDEIYDKLYARLTNQTLVLKPILGELRPLKPRHSSTFASPLDKEIELTENQLKPIIGELRNITSINKSNSIEIKKLIKKRETKIQDLIGNINYTSYEGTLKCINITSSVNCKEWEEEKKYLKKKNLDKFHDEISLV